MAAAILDLIASLHLCADRRPRCIARPARRYRDPRLLYSARSALCTEFGVSGEQRADHRVFGYGHPEPEQEIRAQAVGNDRFRRRVRRPRRRVVGSEGRRHQRNRRRAAVPVADREMHGGERACRSADDGVPPGLRLPSRCSLETQGAVLPLVPSSTPCGGCSSPSRSVASPWRSTRGWTTGSRAGGDRLPHRPAWAWPHRPALLCGSACSSPSCSCCCCRSAAPASGSAGYWSASKHRRKQMTFSGKCWRLRRVALAIATSLPAGCGTGRY